MELEGFVLDDRWYRDANLYPSVINCGNEKSLLNATFDWNILEHQLYMEDVQLERLMRSAVRSSMLLGMNRCQEYKMLPSRTHDGGKPLKQNC